MAKKLKMPDHTMTFTIKIHYNDYDKGLLPALREAAERCEQESEGGGDNREEEYKHPQFQYMYEFNDGRKD